MPVSVEVSAAISRRDLHLLMAGLMVGLLLAELDQTIFATALPTIVGELQGMDAMLWITTAYVLAGTIAMPVVGKLGDLIGRKPVFLVALGVLVLGSIVGGLATDMTWLIVGRAVQGLGGGGLLVLVQAIIADVVPARERAPHLAIIGAVFALAAVVGPVLGGWFAEGIGWRWALWMNVPLGIAAIGVAAMLLPTPPPPQVRVRLDVAGIATLTVAVTGLVLLSTWAGSRYPWGSPVVGVLALVTLAAGAAFVAVEARAEEPLLPLRLVRQQNVAIPTAAGLGMAVAIFGTVNYLPTYLQLASGLRPTAGGLVLLTLMAGIGLATLGAAQLVKRTGRYRVLPIGGCLAAATALLGLSQLPVGADLRVVGAWLGLFGLGMGCALEVLVLVVQNAVGQADLGAATGAYNFFREIGVTLGTAIVGVLFTSRLTALATGQPDAAAYHDALTPVFALLAPLLVLSAVALAFVRPVPLATTSPR